MTKKLVLIISVVLAFLFITANIAFAANALHNAGERVSDGVHNAGAAVGGAVRGTVDNVQNAARRDGRHDGTHMTGVHHTRTHTNPMGANRDGYTATRTNAPFTAGTRTANIVTWSVIGVAALVIVSAVWYYAAHNSRREID